MNKFVLPLIFMFALLSVLAGCGGMDASGDKSAKPTQHTSSQIDELRFANRHLKKENEALKVTNDELQLKLTSLEKRDERLEQIISELNTDLNQRKLLTNGLLEDKNKLLETNRELTARLEKLEGLLRTRKTPSPDTE